MKLEFADRIVKNACFQENLKKINRLESDRIFCRHGIDHLLDTARIAVIMCYEKGIEINKDVIYCSALLHDIGRGQEYTDKIPHEKASVETGGKILDEIGADKEFKKQVLKLISSHRNEKSDSEICRIFFEADKKSRRCFMCDAKEKCKWNDEKKNLILEV